MFRAPRSALRAPHSIEILESRISPAVIAVTGTGNTIAVDGLVTLREAITSANNSANVNADVVAFGSYAGTDTITFNIAGAGVHTINVTSALPTIITPMIINGYTQPGASANTLANGDDAVLLIELNGASAGAGTAKVGIAGLTLGSGSGGSTIEGLVINHFSGDGILVKSAGNFITGNFIGTNPAGTMGGSGVGNANTSFDLVTPFRAGVFIDNVSNNTIGGTTPAARNVISGNILDNIHIVGNAAGATGNVVQGNFVGLNAAGTGILFGSGFFGIELGGVNASSNTIGGTAAGARNVVGGNGAGIEIDDGAHDNTIQGNFSGVGADGVTAAGNRLHGIVLRDLGGSPGIRGNLIGGTNAGAGNVVANNGTGGVAIFGDPSVTPQNINNAILGNSIFNNGRNNPGFELGIDLVSGTTFPVDDGNTPNDFGDGDDGPNHLQNFPVLTSALTQAGETKVKGSLTSRNNSGAGVTYRIEFFSSPAASRTGFGEGQIFLGFIEVTIGAKPGPFVDQGSGTVNFTADLPIVPDGQVVTATATQLMAGSGSTPLSTSEFSAPVLAPLPLAVTLSTDKTSATFTDVDGDLVTVKTTKGKFDGSEFTGIETGTNHRAQLQALTLDADFTGANITITAKPGQLGGNGFVNLGFLDATGVDLGAVSIAGDLGRIKAGTVGGDVKVPAMKSLDVQSIGLLGVSTQASGVGSLVSTINGAVPKLAVKGDVRGGLNIIGVTDGKLGAASIGGSFTTTGGAVTISAAAGIGSLKIGGDIRSGLSGSVSIFTNGAIGAVTVGGSIVGTPQAVTISAFGQLAAPGAGADVAIKSIEVAGSVEGASINAGDVGTNDADASIGSIKVGGDWIASKVTAGTRSGADFKVGTNDDVKISGGNVRDNPAIFSSIGSFTVKGQALGTATPTTDMFGVVAERIGKAKVGGRTFAFVAGTNEAFFAAPTGPGAGTENPAFDFTIRELGSLTPTPAFGGPNLDISTDGKTATYTDADGDLVTVKRSAGGFVAGDFNITANSSGGGQLTKLTISAAPNNALVNLNITARPGPDGGNGFVNLGELSAVGVPFGTVSVAGDVEKLIIGSSFTALPGTGSFSAHSLGVVTAGATPFTFLDGLGKLIVERDVAEATILMNGAMHKTLGSVSIGGNLQDQSLITADDGIGSVKIGGSVLDGRVVSLNGSIGAITVGGDVVGNGVNRTFGASGQLTAPARGIDLAIKSITVKGSVENAIMRVGLTNADASIGPISVGRAWLGSSVLAGVQAGSDTFFGTSDDAKVAAPLRDVAGRFSTIASITIKGQALGTVAGGDSFGIVAEQILAAKIGARTFVFDKGERDLADAFAAAPTGPGPVPDNGVSDFFIREITL